MLDYEDRITFDLAVFIPGFFLIALRLWVRNRNRLPNPELTWVLSDVFVSVALAIAASVISLDIWYMRRRIQLKNFPRKEDPTGFLMESITITVEFLKVYVGACLLAGLALDHLADLGWLETGLFSISMPTSPPCVS